MGIEAMKIDGEILTNWIRKWLADGDEETIRECAPGLTQEQLDAIGAGRARIVLQGGEYHLEEGDH